MSSIFGYVNACRMAYPHDTTNCSFFFKLSLNVIIFHDHELKYSYFDWKNQDLRDEREKNDWLHRWTREEGVM